MTLSKNFSELLLENKEGLPQTTVMIIKGDSGMYLATSRKYDHSLFSCPGGKVEEGETVEESLARELKEETGLDLVRSVLVDVRTYFNKQKTPPLKELVYCYIVIAKGRLSTNEELLARGEGVVKWVTLKELLNGAFADYYEKLAVDLNLK